MTFGALDVDPDTLDEDDVPVPHHPWSTAKRCIREACPAGEHEWVELTGTGRTIYWRECRKCGIADVTAEALGQDVETLEGVEKAREESL